MTHSSTIQENTKISSQLIPKGFMLKMSYNSVDKKYLEIATLGLDVYLTYGYCLYDFELPKSTK